MSAEARLTSDERSRLRPSVNPEALERLLARMPDTMRALLILNFATEQPAPEAIDAMRTAGVSEADLADMGAFDTPLPPHLAHPENDFDPDWVPPTPWAHLEVRPPDDPEIRDMWQEVEPSRRKN